jgi:hypothetical protein
MPSKARYDAVHLGWQRGSWHRCAPVGARAAS